MSRLAGVYPVFILFLVISASASTTSGQTLYWIDAGSIVQFDVATSTVTALPSGTAVTLTADGDAGKLFYFQEPFSLMSADLDGTNATELLTYPFGFEALDANVVNNRVYWLNTFNGQLVSVEYDGANPEVIGGMFFVSGTSVDTVNDKIYYTLDGAGAVARRNFDGSGEEMVVTPGLLTTPQDCRYDSAAAKVYWWDGGDVQRANDDGTELETIVTAATIGGITNFVIDPIQQRAYISTSAGSVWRTNLDGSNPTEIYVSGTNIVELAIIPGSATGPQFVRGDVNVDGGVDIGDPVTILNFLFVAGTLTPMCDDSADVNDDGNIDISDAIFALSSLFVSGSPQPPAPNLCGEDPTPDPLECDAFAICP